jgi:hypothetical protein|tara:strand:+ start:1999 stop:2274 length:276 start_codon:yes stop_codon:yes gene_type:complete
MAQLQINKISSLVKVTETPTSVVVQRSSPQVVEVSALGPQGPPFVGSNFFDVGAIGALSSGDIGKVLKFDGTNFVPTNELETNLTINGGNF